MSLWFPGLIASFELWRTFVWRYKKIGKLFFWFGHIFPHFFIFEDQFNWKLTKITLYWMDEVSCYKISILEQTNHTNRKLKTIEATRHGLMWVKGRQLKIGREFGQRLWLSGQSSCFWHQRPVVWIQSSANFYLWHLFTVNCFEKTKMKTNEAWNVPSTNIFWIFFVNASR